MREFYLLADNSVFYDFLSTTYKLLVGLITKEILTFIALGAILLYVIWMCFSLGFCFPRKFYSRCNKILKNLEQNGETKISQLDEKVSKLSSGFAFAWKKFCKLPNSMPSDVIKRGDVLDVEVKGGILNQGKSLMKTYIYVLTVILFILNLALLGNHSAIDCYIVAESMVLPITFFVIIKLFYFLYTSIKQQIYNLSVESFYELMENLDNICFNVQKQDESLLTHSNLETNEHFDKSKEDIEDQKAFENKDLQQSTTVEEETGIGEVYESGDENGQAVVTDEIINSNLEDTLDKYDIFKKKNIDVEKLVNEVPEINQQNALYINVDSDHVIQDEGAENKGVENASFENNNEFENISEEHEQNTDGQMSEGLNETEPENAFVNVSEINDEQIEDDKNETVENNEVDEENANNDEQQDVQDEDDNLIENELSFQEGEEVEKAPENDLSFDNQDTQNDENSQDVTNEDFEETFSNEQSENKVSQEILSEDLSYQQGDSEESDDDFDLDENEFDEQEMYYNQSENDNEDHSVQLKDDIDTQDIDFFGEDDGQQYYITDENEQSDNASEITNEDEADEKETMTQVDDESELSLQNPQQVSTEEDAPLLRRNLGNVIHREEVDMENIQKNLDELMGIKHETDQETNQDFASEIEKEDEGLMKRQTTKRGRPKNNLKVAEGMQINSDEEFAECLSRAEKLMRKSEEGLSQSQSKRIEKELKILMDAMNKYKESKQ